LIKKDFDAYQYYKKESEKTINKINKLTDKLKAAKRSESK
jgi:hypothetical protein